MMDDQPGQELLRRTRVNDLDDRRSVFVARVIAGEEHDVGLRANRHIARQREFGDQRAEGDLSLRVDIWDGVHEEVVAADLHLVPFIAQLLEVGAMTYQWV